MPLQRAICQSTRNSRCYNVLCRCDKPGSRTYVLSLFSHVRLSVTLWTIARQAPLSMGFPRQEYWSGLPFPSLQGIFLTQGLSPGLLHCRHIIYCLSPQAKKFKKPVKDTRNCWVIKPMVQ